MFKDTKEGQTHSYNDGCGEPEHNDIDKENNYESKGGYCAVHTGILNNGACINSDEHEDVLECILEMIEEMKSSDKEHVCITDDEMLWHVKGYDAALSNLSAKIKKELK